MYQLAKIELKISVSPHTSDSVSTQRPIQFFLLYTNCVYCLEANQELCCCLNDNRRLGLVGSKDTVLSSLLLPSSVTHHCPLILNETQLLPISYAHQFCAPSHSLGSRGIFSCPPLPRLVPAISLSQMCLSVLPCSTISFQFGGLIQMFNTMINKQQDTDSNL